MSIVEQLITEDGVAFQLRIWKYALTGDMLEVSARAAEDRQYPLWPSLWDRTAHDLEGQVVSHGDGDYRPVSAWAALPWVTEHLLRGHGPWPGL